MTDRENITHDFELKAGWQYYWTDAVIGDFEKIYFRNDTIEAEITVNEYDHWFPSKHDVEIKILEDDLEVKNGGLKIDYSINSAEIKNAAAYDSWLDSQKKLLDEIGSTLIILDTKKAVEDACVRFANDKTDGGIVYVAFSDNTAVFSDGWIPDGNWNPTERYWYILAMDADGAAVATEYYEDYFSGRMFVTIAKHIGKINGLNAVLGVDLAIPNEFFTNAEKYAAAGESSGNTHNRESSRKNENTARMVFPVEYYRNEIEKYQSDFYGFENTSMKITDLMNISAIAAADNVIPDLLTFLVCWNNQKGQIFYLYTFDENQKITGSFFCGQIALLLHHKQALMEKIGGTILGNEAISMGDFNHDGINEIALFSQNQNVGYVFCVYGFNTPANIFEELCAVPVFINFESIFPPAEYTGNGFTILEIIDDEYLELAWNTYVWDPDTKKYKTVNQQNTDQ
ncbi:hypothetical protein [Breznakiella homolactica]|uniref:Uncharacterized protein n=1 Tax=Breznakiella homolactica TaxID=2798577 RepID=A0A7T7XPC2_9SPIR|nr:hypothetical protein [Breznakiella homolactica]QQO10029.1 hypothetical protein JFL75_03695 [Breznakiella homolactica]